MGGDHGHHGPGHGHPPVPDYKIYKVDDAPKLVELRESLKRQGLRDPWIRNEVWRFNDPKLMGGSNWVLLRQCLFKGFGFGFVAFVATLGIEKALGIDWHDPRGLHKNGHGHEGAHH